MNEVNLTEKELLEMPKEDLVGMVLGMQSNINEMKSSEWFWVCSPVSMK